MKILDLAENGNEAIARSYEVLAQEAAPAPAATELAAFADYVQDNQRLSINMRASRCADFFEERVWLTLYAWAERRARDEGCDVQDILRKRLRSFYPKRIAFDEAYDPEHSLHYAAVNTGGAGATFFGQFCCVIEDDYVREDGKAAFLMGNSLVRYVDDRNQIDHERLRGEICTRSECHHLATIKYADRLIRGCACDGWPSLVCSGCEYIEVLFSGTVHTSCIAEVRVDREAMRGVYQDALFARLAGDTLDTTTTLVLVDLDRIVTALADVGKKLVEV